MKKGNFEQKDFLDTLRQLNSSNINESVDFKNNFFDSLMTNEEFLPEHIRELSKYWIEAMKKQSDGEFKNYLLNNIYITQIANQLSDCMIEDNIDCLYVNSKDAYHVLTYLGSIKGEKELVEELPEGFDMFKQHFLLGLITRYVPYVVRRNQNIERFEKLVNIYIEQQLIKKFGIEQQSELQSYIDEEFIDELKEAYEGFFNINKMDSILMNLLNRKSPNYRKKSIEEIIVEYKHRLMTCKSMGESYEIIKALDKLYCMDSYSHYYDAYELKKKI